MSCTFRQFSSVLNPKQARGEVSEGKEKRLSDIFKLELVEDKNATEIQIIWEEYHKSKEVISAAIPWDTYASLQVNMQQSPTFLFPLPRSQGYEFFMCQSYGHTVHCTPLLAYQVWNKRMPLHLPRLASAHDCFSFGVLEIFHLMVVARVVVCWD